MKIKYCYTFVVVVMGLILVTCTHQSVKRTIVVKNHLNIDRYSESVIVTKSMLDIKDDSLFLRMGVFDPLENRIVTYQYIDSNDDGKPNAILFQPGINKNGLKKYIIRYNPTTVSFKSKVYSRIVPERMDDYAWENDRVAFRMYGPKAQLLFEENRVEGKNAGIISSGVDCWFKRVNYPIINKWYKKDIGNTGSYHKDTGEGYDHYHVGTSRGCGGIGVWENNVLYTSKNFTHWKTLENGPIRTRFALDYAPWMANNKMIHEKLIISLEAGNNLSKVRAKINGVDTISVGITLHDMKGEIIVDTIHDYFTYWEPSDTSKVGTAIVVDPKYYVGYTKYITEKPDQSHLLIHLKVINGEVIYYSGFGWTGSGQFNNKLEWEKYLERFSQEIRNPLLLKIKN